MTENEHANKVIGLAIEVHKDLGPGLLERAYEECLFYKIVSTGLQAEKQKGRLFMKGCIWNAGIG